MLISAYGLEFANPEMNVSLLHNTKSYTAIISETKHEVDTVYLMSLKSVAYKCVTVLTFDCVMYNPSFLQ